MTIKQKPQLLTYGSNNKKFYSASATGNTFFIVDLCDGTPLDVVKDDLVRALITESKDSGLVFQKTDTGYYRMRVVEKDGSESAFCGNGARVFAHYLHYANDIEQAQLQGPNSETVLFGKKEQLFFVQCGQPHVSKKLALEGHNFEHFEVCGEPHLITSDFFDRNQLISVGKRIQQSYSINISCIRKQKILTYERGVAAITASCGRACVAATQYFLNYQSSCLTEKTIFWDCPGGVNWVDTETFCLLGPTWLESNIMVAIKYKNIARQ